MFVPRSVSRRPAIGKGHAVGYSVLGKRRGASAAVGDACTAIDQPVSSAALEKSALEHGVEESRRPKESEEAVSSAKDKDEGEEEEDLEEEVLSYSKQQRWPAPGEPVCVVCGRYGAYIVDQTDADVCSLECKGRHLQDLGKPLLPPTLEEEGGWSYKEHADIAAMSETQVAALRREVCRGEGEGEGEGGGFSLSLSCPALHRGQR